MLERSANGSVCEKSAASEIAGVRVKRLVVSNFRNYASLELHLPADKNCVVLHGANGCGKTNLLEAVSFLTAGRGLRNVKLDDVAARGNPEALWSVSAIIAKGAETFTIGTGKTAKDATERRRRVRIDGEECKNQAELAALTPMVWLTPSMDRLFCAEASSRRRFFDRLCHCFDARHAAHCTTYANALRQYNKLRQDGSNDADWLKALESTMARSGALIFAARERVLDLLNAQLNSDVDGFPRAAVSLTQSADEDDLRRLFAKARENGDSLRFAPHLSDLIVENVDKNMPAALCSTGEQKALLITILLAHLKAVAKHAGVLPMLLLDEAGAHLDEDRRNRFFEYLKTPDTQIWLTGTRAESFSVLKDAAHFCPVEDFFNAEPFISAEAS